MPPRNAAYRNDKPTQNVNLVDCNSLLEAGDSIAAAERLDRVQIEYSKLRSLLTSERTKKQWAQAEVSIALVSANEESEGQQRFTTMLTRSGFETDVSSYRDNYVSLPAGRKPADFYDQNKDKRERPLVSLAPRITYALGLLARCPEPQVLIVSHAFELYWPMLNFAQRNERARVGLAFFGGLLDYRWKQGGLFDSENPIEFFDLDDHSAELLGGIDLSGRARGQVAASPLGSGLSRL